MRPSQHQTHRINQRQCQINSEVLVLPLHAGNLTRWDLLIQISAAVVAIALVLSRREMLFQALKDAARRFDDQRPEREDA